MRRRRPLPSSRAVVGGLVVAVAMLASFAVAGRSRGAPKGRVVVARHDVHLGARLHADDLGVVAVDLPGRAAAETFSSPADLDGAVALAPLRAGDVIDRSAVSTDPGEPGGAQLSFPLDRDRALDGDLDLGEQLDLLATFGSGETARTQVVARRVRLVAVDTDGGGLEDAGKLVVTVELPDSTDLLAVTHAAQVGDVTLARAG
ncbi:MAG TPA: SAF domain-containing protein [Acidimicrobiales bacterium]|nr:SAF domain-containing protein [Acidimicrobiales bacterium]